MLRPVPENHKSLRGDATPAPVIRERRSSRGVSRRDEKQYYLQTTPCQVISKTIRSARPTRRNANLARTIPASPTMRNEPDSHSIWGWRRLGIRTPDVWPSIRKLTHSLSHRPRDVLYLVGYFLGRGSRREARWLADHHRQLSGARNLVAGHLHLVQAIDPYRNNRNVQARRQHPDPRAERGRLAIRRAHAFGINQNAVASIYRFTGVGETLAHARLLRQRKDVEQGNHQVVASPIRQALKEIPGLRRAPHLPQHLSPHADRELVPHAGRERDQREANIDVGNVVATDEDRPVDPAKVLAANDLGVRHDHGRRPGEQVVDEVANPRDGPALRPSRIPIPALRRLLRLAQQAFEILNRSDAGEVRLVEIDLVAVFQRAHQLDAVHGAQVQVSVEPGIGGERAGAASGDARDQVRQSALRHAGSVVA